MKEMDGWMNSYTTNNNNKNESASAKDKRGIEKHIIKCSNPQVTIGDPNLPKESASSLDGE